MKTTIEVHGYQITIDEMHDKIQVTAEKEGETVEEFVLDVEEMGDEGEMDMKSFAGEEEEDFDEDDDFGGEDDDMEEDEMEEDEMEEDEMPEEGKTLESFSHFVRRRNK